MPEPQQEAGAVVAPDRPPMKHSETQDSISSEISDVSLTLDREPLVGRTIAGKEKTDLADLADLSDSASEGSKDKTSVSSREVKKARDEDAEEAPFEPPDEEQCQRIIDQVEFYFSDVNITKDAFLLKHVKRNKEGYVSLKLISSFKRVKHIAKDWRVVAYALAKSKKLEINEAGTKLRRLDPLPAYDQTTPSRTVVAIDLPLEKPTIENVAEMFRGCGEIALIRILRPGNPIPADVRHFYNKHPEMNGTVSALVEFVRTESAHNAINRTDWDWRQSSDHDMAVLELNAPPSDRKKKTKKTSMIGRALTDSDYSTSCTSASEDEMRHRIRMQRRCSSPHLIGRDTSHWAQRRWSRDSGTDSSSSGYSRSRSNSGVFFMPDLTARRVSTGWESSSDSYNSARSRSNSGISIPDVGMTRRYSKDGGDCCCCHDGCQRRGSKDSGSEGYFSDRSRCNSNASDIRRKDSIEYYSPSLARRFSNCKDVPEFVPMRQRSNSNVSITDGVRRMSSGRDSDSEGRMTLVRQRSNPHMDNVVRLPRGPDGGRGFIPGPTPACHTLVE